ncbi:MAG: DAPG hydrolase family protein [Polyangiales bacterium]
MDAPTHDLRHLPEVRLEDGIFRPSAALRISEAIVAAVRAGLQPSERGLSLAAADALLEPGYLGMENGYARLDDAMLYVAALTPMPGVTGEMIDWWFAWHGEESARYQLWHPRDHVSARWRHPVTCAGGGREEWQRLYRSNVSEVDEYVGSTLMRLSIAFADPCEYLDPSRFEASGTEAVICARTYSRRENVAAGHVLHHVRRTNDGVEMRSRFWLADFDSRELPVIGPLLRPLLNSRPMRRMLVPNGLGRDLLLHCAEEMTHLAEFLPALFRRVVHRG